MPTPVANHVSNALRMKTGDALMLFNGDGYDYRATLLSIKRNQVTVRVHAQVLSPTAPSCHITLAQAISARERMDYTIQKAVELGVSIIQPLDTERSIVRLDAEKIAKRLQHWQNIVIAACEQTGRATVPTVQPALPLYEWLQRDLGKTHKIILDPDVQQGLHSLPVQAKSFCLLVGCEGGFSPQEIRQAIQQDYYPVRLGYRIFRTETAGIVAMAAIHTLFGDFTT